MRLRRRPARTKLDRRRARSRMAHAARAAYGAFGDALVREHALYALAGPPGHWRPGKEGSVRFYLGRAYVFHCGECPGCRGLPPPGLWFIDKA